MKKTKIEHYAQFVVSNPWRLVFLSLVIVLVFASGGRFLEFTNDFREYFSEENPQLLAFDEMEKSYSKADNVMFVIEPVDGNVFTKETLQIVEKLTEQAWQLPFASRVDSLTNFQHTVLEGNELKVRSLVNDAEKLTPTELDEIKSSSLQEPLLLRRFISPQGHVTGVNVTVQLPREELSEILDLVAAARSLRSKILAEHPGINIYISGVSLMNNAFGEAAEQDMQTLIPIMFLVVIIMLGILLRSATATLSIIIMIIASILFAMGTMGWSGLKLSPPSASAPTIILTMAIANAVHILVTFLHNMRQGMAKTMAMVESILVNIQPIFITSVTTAIGFLSMNFSDVPPFRDLGNIVAVGVMIAFVLSVSFLPAIMMILPVRVKTQTITKSDSSMMDKFADFVIVRRRRLLWIMGTIALILISLIPLNKLDDKFIEYFDKTIEFRTDTDFQVDNLNGTDNIQYSLHQGKRGGVSDPDFLIKVEQFTDWLRTENKVVSVTSITDIVKRLNMTVHDNDAAYYRLPATQALARKYLNQYEERLPENLGLYDQINSDKSAIRVTVSFEHLRTEEILEFERKINHWLVTNAPEIEFSAASMSLMFAYIGKRNVNSMLAGTTIALVLISLIMIIALRSLRIGLISLIPNLIPVGVAFGIWAILVGQVGLSLSIVIGMTMGIVVDDTVHFLSKYLAARRDKGMDSEAAVRYAFSTVGMALWVTSLVLVAGFTVLGQSHFSLNADMGIMAALTIGIALVMDFLLLPPLLMAIDRGKVK